MIIPKVEGYAYNDLTIVPETISRINSRSECNPYYKDGMLPIFTAPMAAVVSDKNYKVFEDNKITPIIPRNIELNTRLKLCNKGCWVALSLKEFTELFLDNAQDRIVNNTYNICVDIANGHMRSLYQKCIKAKELARDNQYKLTIMTGNIANPKTYDWICFNAVYEGEDGYNISAIDYIRVGIGGGSGCITTSNVSAHYPQASLIDECKKIKDYYEDNYGRGFPAIIADGGIRNYDHVIKALALGADYVMIGSLFAQCIESAGDKYDGMDVNYAAQFNYDAWVPELLQITKNDEWVGYIKQLKDEEYIGKLYVKFFGMASADGQKSISGKKTKTSEGITKWLPVKYTLNGWVENMMSYLRSAMSYCDCYDIYEFIGKPQLIKNSISEINAVNK